MAAVLFSELPSENRWAAAVSHPAAAFLLAAAARDESMLRFAKSSEELGGRPGPHVGRGVSGRGGWRSSLRKRGEGKKRQGKLAAAQAAVCNSASRPASKAFGFGGQPGM